FLQKIAKDAKSPWTKRSGSANREEAHQVHRAIKLGRIFATKGTEGTKGGFFGSLIKKQDIRKA
ncbi:MAG: hypothetical protein N2A42_04400, partial [Luteolibacter sp.]